MEKHKCKLCFRSFANGRALGGHMRSHMLNLPVPPKPEQEEEEHPHNQISEEADSASSSSSSSSSDDEEEQEQEQEGEENSEKGLSYGLRENPKRSVRLVDPEFSFAVVDAGSVVLQDRESETESSKNPTRRRSKRTRKLIEHHQYCNHQIQDQENLKKLKFHKLSNKKSESWAEPEPVSSISDCTTEEDVAFCLMMLSRDKWKKKEKLVNEQEHEELEAEEETDESDEFKSCKTRTRGKYRCETCKKSFKSYQALGGHRASHKKIKATLKVQVLELLETENNAGPQKKIYECPYCYRVFSSGQALGGHKRSHLITGSAPPPPAAAATPVRSSTISNNFIDLNLPAPIEDDISQIELSAVSDAEFVNHVRR